MATNTPTATANMDTLVTTHGSLLNVNTSNITKLNTSNYLMWSRQIQALLDGYDLSSFLDGSKPLPPAVITVDDKETPNPEFLLHNRQDKLVYSAILGAISQSIQPLLSKANTSAEIWTILASTYAKPSRGHIKQLQNQLKNWKKDTKTISEYLQGISTRVDQLALLGKVLDLEDQIELALEGLPDDYKQVVDQIESRDTPPTFNELHEKLLNQEARLLSAQTSQSFPVTANVATNNYRPFQKNNNNRNSQWQTPNPQTPNGTRSPRPYLGRCQICGIQGHSARRCNQLAQHTGLLPTPRGSQPRANYVSPSLNPWLLDSGATHHIASDLANLSLHQPYSGGQEVVVGNGAALPIVQTGSTLLKTSTRPLHLNNILHVPAIHKNLISVYKLCNANQVSVQFYPSCFQVRDLKTGVPLLQGNTKNELYEWPISLPIASTFYTATNNLKTTISDWHSRLGHPSYPILKTILSQFSLPYFSSMSQSLSCSDCSINKTHKLSFSESSISSTRPLQYLFSDVWTSPILSIDNYKYYLIIVDHYSRYIWLYPLKLKSQVKETFIRFTTLAENKFQVKVGTLFSDNGGEFIALRDFLASKGISHLTSPPHTPEHNGLAERRHRHIVETGLTLLTTAKLPLQYWTYALSTAVYLINRMPTQILSNQSPYQTIFKEKPNYTKLKIFGCLCFPWLRPYTPHKLAPRSVPCIFLGYSLTQSAYLCMDQITKRVYIFRHVKFDETTFPYSSTAHSTPLSKPENHNSYHPPPTQIPIPSPPLNTAHSAPLGGTANPDLDSSPEATPDHATSPSPAASPENSTEEPSSSHDDTNEALSEEDNSVSSGSQDMGPNSTTAHSTEHQPTNHSQAQSTTNPSLATPSSSSSPATTVADPLQNQHPMQTRAKNQIRKPNQRYGLSALIHSGGELEPTTITQALKHDKWRTSASAEFDAQVRNRTWDLVPPSPHQHVIDCKWLFRLKYLPDGTIDKRKSRLVTRGYKQQAGIDYFETFSPVIKSTTIRTVLNVAASRDWCLRQIDINNAFLQATLTEEVYMTQPPGFIDPDKPNHVCRLNKAIYGLKQAPRAWYDELKTFLLQLGFKNSVADTALFVLQQGNTLIYLLVYVDDIVVTGNDKTMVEKVLTSLANRFSLKDMGELSYFLGIEVVRSSNGLHLSQRKYIYDLLHKFQMQDAKPASTPIATNPKLTMSGQKHDNITEYRTLVGSLQYLAFTRPDIAYVVNKLSQFMHSPTTDHWQAAKRVLRYLAGTPTYGLFYSKSNPLSLHAFSDADWAGDSDDYVSTNAYIVYLGKHAISWSAKKQNGVARSSTEAEYRAVANTASELNWTGHLLHELGIQQHASPTIYCDNIGTTYLCANPVFHSRMKHLALDYHFIRNQVQTNKLRVSHVSTKDQLADGLTKPLSRQRFTLLRDKIGVSKGP